MSGLAWPGGYGDPAESLTERRDIAYASGAAFAIRADLFRELGGFTEELFLYQEDLELCWRAQLAGRRVVVEPGADVLHDYVLERPGPPKEYYLERNRLIFVLTAFSGGCWCCSRRCCSPSRLGISLVALRQGWLREKPAAGSGSLRNRAWLAAHRRARRRSAASTIASSRAF